jgi:hypothetical protein
MAHLLVKVGSSGRRVEGGANETRRGHPTVDDSERSSDQRRDLTSGARLECSAALVSVVLHHFYRIRHVIRVETSLLLLLRLRRHSVARGHLRDDTTSVGGDLTQGNHSTQIKSRDLRAR